jgi:hypothetical protein
MAAKTISINHAPVLTLWAAVVAESLLRMYDLVTGLRSTSRTQQQRARNHKLQKRKGA